MTSPPSATRTPLPIFRLLFGDLQTGLTTLCGLALATSFFIQRDIFAYLSVACGSYYAVRSTLSSLRQREIDVNLLMVIAAIGAVAIHQTQDAAGLLFLFSLSSTMEAFALAKTKSAIESLVRLRPSQALRVRDGAETLVNVEDLRTGDIIRVNGFEGIPSDGTITEGLSAVDESALTGEAEPVSKGPESEVTGGTQNLDGTLFVRVTKEIGNSVLDQIVSLVRTAQENKATDERISEWFGQRYTIFVILAFVIAWVVRLAIGQPPADAFYSALTLLVGLSPCALVISTPAATLSALANAARKGILVRGGEFIEKVANINVVAMDKTGTLTKGKPRLVEMVTANDQVWHSSDPTPPTAELRSILANVAAIEKYSSHPLAKALVSAAKEFELAVPLATESRIVPGKGAVGTIYGVALAVGNEAMLHDQSRTIPPELETKVAAWKDTGRTSVLAANSQFVAAFAFEDEIRPEARAVLEDMRSLGIARFLMLTGDKPETAHTVAERVGVTEVRAGLLPADKTEIIRELSTTERVMMVGDGVNDAPSLAQATVGVAMGGLGSDVALNAADVVLMHDKLERIPDLIRLSRRTKGIIRANLIFAAGVIIMLTVSSFVTKLPLPLAVIGHEGSTVLVILNGLRLLRD